MESKLQFKMMDPFRGIKEEVYEIDVIEMAKAVDRLSEENEKLRQEIADLKKGNYIRKYPNKIIKKII